MSKSPVHFDKELAATLGGLASANSVSVALIIAAMRNASVWEVIGGGAFSMPALCPRRARRSSIRR